MTASARLLAAVAVALASLAGASTALATTPDTTAAPATTAAPDTTAAPATTAAPGTTTPDDDGSDIDWAPIALVAALAIVLIAIIVAFAARRRPSAAAGTTAPRSNTYEIELLGTAQWFHDQLSLELLAASPEQAQQRWTVERSRVDGIVIGAQQQAARSNPEAWSRLGQAVSLLSGALDTTIQLRNQPDPDPALVAESGQVVNRRRAELQSLITAMAPLVRG